MSLSIIQAGSSLQLVSDAGVLTTLTLPTGVTLRTDVPPRWTVFQRNVILVNTPSQPLTIDAYGVVRLLTPKPPRVAPVLTGPNAGGLTGTFRAKMTNVLFDAAGNLLAESDFSPFSAPVTIVAKSILASNLDISPDDIDGRRLYRTTDNGAVYFQWVDIDGNVVTSIQDDLADAGLSLVAAPTLGTPPRLTTVAEFRGRLFGSGDIDIDHLRYTEAGVQYAWPEDNVLSIPPIGGDEFGIVGLMPRREALGVCRRNLFAQITGSGTETDDIPDLDVVVLSKELGVESQETVKIFRDAAYFLWKDGVYKWDSSGFTCISNGAGGKGNVRSWFTTDNYFNTNVFTSAFAHIDPFRPVYRLFLAAAGGSTINRWVEYDIEAGTWWGPHSTDLFSPTSAFEYTDTYGKTVPVMGGATAVYEEQATRTDGTATPISFDVIGKRHDLGAPDEEKYFGEISLMGKAQASGTLSVVSRVGEVEATSTLTQSFTLTNTRQRLGRLGQGKHAQVELTNATQGVDVELYGYEINPVNLVGRR